MAWIAWMAGERAADKSYVPGPCAIPLGVRGRMNANESATTLNEAFHGALPAIIKDIAGGIEEHYGVEWVERTI